MLKSGSIYKQRVFSKKGFKIGHNQIDFERIWLIIPFIFYGIGFFIHNVYLSRFSTFDFEVIQTKYIYIGFLFSFYTVLLILFFIIRMGNPQSKNRKLNTIVWLIRIPIACIILHLILFPSKSLIEYLFVKNENALTFILYTFTLMVILIYVFWVLLFDLQNSYTPIKVDKIIKYFFVISIVPIVYTLFLFYKNKKHS